MSHYIHKCTCMYDARGGKGGGGGGGHGGTRWKSTIVGSRGGQKVDPAKSSVARVHL